MNIIVILAHPNKNSFNHAIANRVIDTLNLLGHKALFHDLYAEKFDPLFTSVELKKNVTLEPVIERHCAEVAQADGFVIIHPNWWGMPPAILKGWVDRVIRPEVGYRFEGEDMGEGMPKGLLKAQTALVINTTDTNMQREQEVFGDPLDTIWKNCIFGLCGITDFHRKVIGTIVISTKEQREQWLDESAGIVGRLFPKTLISSK